MEGELDVAQWWKKGVQGINPVINGKTDRKEGGSSIAMESTGKEFGGV